MVSSELRGFSFCQSLGRSFIINIIRIIRHAREPNKRLKMLGQLGISEVNPKEARHNGKRRMKGKG